MRPETTFVMLVVVVIVSKSSNASIPPLGCFIIRAEKRSLTLDDLLLFIE